MKALLTLLQQCKKESKTSLASRNQGVFSTIKGNLSKLQDVLKWNVPLFFNLQEKYCSYVYLYICVYLCVCYMTLVGVIPQTKAVINKMLSSLHKTLMCPETPDTQDPVSHTEILYPIY